jgi:hypothetical protein
MNLFRYVYAIIVPENFVLQFCGFAVLQLMEKDSGIIVKEKVSKKVVQSCSHAVVELVPRCPGLGGGYCIFFYLPAIPKGIFLPSHLSLVTCYSKINSLFRYFNLDHL